MLDVMCIINVKHIVMMDIALWALDIGRNVNEIIIKIKLIDINIYI